jgi:putative hemolysin
MYFLSMAEIIIIAVCLVLNALFAAYEMAFVSIPKPELRRLVRNGNKEAQRILNLRENPERTLSIIQIGITLVGAVSAAVGGAGAAESIEPYFQNQFRMTESMAEFISILLVVLPLTYLSVVIGELVPKSLALKNPVRIALLGSRPLLIADRIFSPAVSFLEWSTKQILRFVFPRSKNAAPVPETSLEIDALPQHHQEAVLNLAHIERRRIKDIFVPWKDVNFIRSTDTMEDVVPVIFASGHTRLPVTDNGSVAGILHTKEFLAFRETGSNDWMSIIRPSLTIQLTDSVLAILRLMQSKRNHMAIVVSPTGERLGIVTLEDISEEIWGDIFDEDDDSRIRKIFANRVKVKIRPPEP